MIAFLIDLEAVLKKHSGGFTLSSRQEGVFATINDDWDTKVNIGFPSHGKCDFPHNSYSKKVAK